MGRRNVKNSAQDDAEVEAQSKEKRFRGWDEIDREVREHFHDKKPGRVQKDEPRFSNRAR